MKKNWCAANWKLNKSPNEAKAFLQEFLAQAKKLKCQTVIYPQNFSCTTVAEQTQGTDVFWGAQNCYYEDSGAFTGENSSTILKEMGATTVLIGHSERRSLFSETDEDIAKKIKSATQAGLVPLLCIGELESERESGKTEEKLLIQLEKALTGFDTSRPLVIAYEPVWAIGTGKVATPEIAENTHLYIRETLSEIFNPETAEQTPLLYGGSVKPENAEELGSQPNIDGFLIGGASLAAESFLKIAEILDRTNPS